MLFPSYYIRSSPQLVKWRNLEHPETRRDYAQQHEDRNEHNDPAAAECSFLFLTVSFEPCVAGLYQYKAMRNGRG